MGIGFLEVASRIKILDEFILLTSLFEKSNQSSDKVKFMQSIFQKLAFIFLIVGLLFNPQFLVNAQNTDNPIGFSIPAVTVAGKRLETNRLGPNNWDFGGNLGDDDEIRYGWRTVAIDLSYKTSPTAGGGWIRVYIGDDSKPENAILDFGNSPIKVGLLAKRLVTGSNKLLFVFVDETNDPAKSRVRVNFTFNYQKIVAEPRINILNPSVGAILMKDTDRRFRLELFNFTLGSDPSNQDNYGQMRVYANRVEGRPLVTIKSSTEIESGKQLVEFSSSDFATDIDIPDSKNTNLIFVLTRANGELLNFRAERSVVTNYQESLQDIGLPTVRITEPKADRVDQSIDGDRQFLLQISNFELLAGISEESKEDKKGYLQIIIDDKPVKTLWPKAEFTLNEIGYGSDKESRRTVKVQLVNKDFTKLSPEASSSVDIIYKPKNVQAQLSDQNNSTDRIETNNWRLVIIGMVLILIIGGIVVLVTRG